ncbi:hypothetical protein BGZ54_006396 [Gamsiella multidivaricata]|nr:hypothetical protein BGZ54_006396 [Gamsiella multidivaricata]
MTLRKISLANRIGIENFMLEIILRSCPGLERFQSLDFTFREEMVGTYVDPVLEVQDLQSVVPSLLYDYGEMSSPGDDTHGTGWIGPMPGRMLEPGWVCRGLKVLCIQYAEKTDEVIPGTLYSQIMRLEHLEELYLSRKILPLPATPAIIAAGADAQRRLAEEE